MVARKIRTIRKTGVKKINERKCKKHRPVALPGSRINVRIERKKTFPKALPGTEMVRKRPRGSRTRFLHRKTP